MNCLHIGLLACALLVTAACSQRDAVEVVNTPKSASTLNSPDATGGTSSECDCEGIEKQIQETRAAFKKHFPTPDNIEEVKLLWAEAEKDYLMSGSKGVSAKVEIIDVDDTLSYGFDVFIISNGVKQVREYRNELVAVTFDDQVCTNHEKIYDSLGDFSIQKYIVKMFSEEGGDYRWECETYEDSVAYELRQIDFDYVIESSINRVDFNGKPARELNLLMATDFSTSPFEKFLKVTLVVGESDAIPRILRIKEAFGMGNEKAVHWIYDYEYPVSFVVLPKEQISLIQED